MTTTTEKLSVSLENAPKFADWLANRGGLLVWQSHDLSNPGQSCTTPALTDGKPTTSPHWRYTANPARHITSAEDIVVYVPRVVREIVVKLQVRGQYGQKLQLTTGSSNRLRRALASANDIEREAGRPDSAFYRFKSTGTGQGDPIHGLTHGEDTVEICVHGEEISFAYWLKDNPL